jgi:hypothetical protein
MSNQSLPRWAILPAAWKLITSSLRHPNSGKVVFVDEPSRRVTVRSIKGDGRVAAAATDERPAA